MVFGNTSFTTPSSSTVSSLAMEFLYGAGAMPESTAFLRITGMRAVLARKQKKPGEPGFCSD
jgi:hypothetical protein